MRVDDVGAFEWGQVRRVGHDGKAGPCNAVAQLASRRDRRALVVLPNQHQSGAVDVPETVEEVQLGDHIAACVRGSSASRVLLTRSMRSGRSAAVCAVNQRSIVEASTPCMPDERAVAALARMPARPSSEKAAAVSISVSERTTAGSVSASDWASMPPTDNPTRCTPSAPRPRTNARTASVARGSVQSSPVPGLAPCPGRSQATTS